MQSSAEVKAGESRVKTGDNLEAWSCGCSTVVSMTPVHAKCTSCGNIFNKISKKKLRDGKGKVEKLRIEMIGKARAFYSEAVQELVNDCERCDGTGQIRVYNQEWDRIKSYMAPCPMCRSQEWSEWSAGKRIIQEKP